MDGQVEETPEVQLERVARRTSSGARPRIGTAHPEDDWFARRWNSRTLHRVSEATAHAGAGVVAAAVMVAWLAVGMAVGFPGWWQTTLYSSTAAVTFVMVFVIQHTQARQVAATQRKLDELIRSSVRADDRLIAVEEATDEQLQALTDVSLAARQQR